MVTIGPDGRTMRRTLDRADITSLATDNDMIVAMEALTRARLVVVQQNAVEIVHDALIHAWPRFRQWLAEDAARIQLIGQLAESSKAWIGDGRDSAYLYRGTRLTVALASLADQRDVPATGREFLAASRRLQRSQSRRRHGVIAALVALVLSSLLAAGVAIRQEATAMAQRATALSQQVAFESQTISDPNISALLAVAAWHIAPTTQASNSLITTFARENVTTLTNGTGSVFSLAFSADGKILATAGSDRTVRLWDLATSRQITKPLRTSADLTQVAYNPDGKILATADSNGAVRLWDVEISQQPSPRVALRIGNGLTWVAFSLDGRMLATAGQGGPIRIWNITTAQPWSSRVLAGSYDARDVIFNPDGRTLAAVTAAGGIGLWNTATGQQIFAIPSSAVGGRISSVTFSPDGRILAVGGTDATVRLLSAKTGRQAGTLQTGNGSTQVAFSPNGRMLATASTDGTVRLWDMTTNRQIGAPLTADGISEAAFSPDGRTLVTASVSANPAVQLWKLPTTTSATQLSRAICAKVGHDLTPTQWAHYIPDIPYQSSCRP